MAGKLAGAKVVAANAKGDTVVQGIDKVLADKKTADEKLQVASTQLKNADERLQTATAQLRTTDEKLKTTETRLQAVTDSRKADAQLLRELTGKLVEAKVVAPTDRGAALVRGVEQLIQKSLRAATSSPLPNVGVAPLPNQRPGLEPLPAGDAVAAEEAYARGLVDFWAGRYQDAEGDFAQAVRTAGRTGQDARYDYFLGLAQFLQGKREDAQATFQVAAQLERDHRPPSRVVSDALERVQGQLRRTVDSYRP
jgi:TolA-binding protein